ncbi:putative RNA-directed DNA polymerase from transposon BS [Nephila pilipes]|uniref:Putative RNA-directed DNA polymerase from transposon BS n=1 Tax=Nephila pilipes TaxID=299642 RepID=A0A8X6PJ85_NEPPI|nr:putative RNA-directed DNA polymerase from transposon BS [Nephila pilipes]
MTKVNKNSNEDLSSSKLSWNFDKANWNTFESISTERLSQNPLTEDLGREWSHFKDSIFRATKQAIPRGKGKKRVKQFENSPHNSEESVRDTHNMKPNNHTISVFLDLTKAFDKEWKHKLLVKCHNEFKSELESSHGFKISRSADLCESMAGMEKMVISCNFSLFADDVVIWKSDEDTTKIENSSNENLVTMQFC